MNLCKISNDNVAYFEDMAHNKSKKDDAIQII